MNKFKEIKPEEFNKSPFQIIGKDWMLITAEKDNKVNTMTAAWGGFGFIFNKNVVYIVIRPERYTKQFVDNSDTFSLTFFDENFKKQLSYLGTVSGRDEDKISKTNLTIKHSDNTPYFEEANTAIICRKLYVQGMNRESFIANEVDIEKMYPDKNFHTLYIAEVEKILIRE
ncbi:flavin reductase family protein [Clostridium estertheticum]|uniref:Flavin reductase family protein n=1 Tax=Clostridium estertheticum TaxID=238834 RepID=A0A7Y3WV37_9CLOT|nr:flavin reductase [Clostridium estertheticum]NNU78733.1 flavin reductase family protein [Clostridium estertheticum]WBL45251.1 flavin reductase [Clostridium estertheticum]